MEGSEVGGSGNGWRGGRLVGGVRGEVERKRGTEGWGGVPTDQQGWPVSREAGENKRM